MHKHQKVICSDTKNKKHRYF